LAIIGNKELLAKGKPSADIEKSAGVSRRGRAWQKKWLAKPLPIKPTFTPFCRKN
jgi:hypothetical protein